MRGEAVERRLDERIVRDRARPGAEPREPGRALAVVGEQAVHVSPGDPPVRRDRAVRRPIGKLGERARAIRPRGHAHMHLVAAERRAEGFALRRLEPLIAGEHGLDIEQA